MSLDKYKPLIKQGIITKEEAAIYKAADQNNFTVTIDEERGHNEIGQFRKVIIEIKKIIRG